VEADHGQAGSHGGFLELSAEALGQKHRTVRPAEHEVGLARNGPLSSRVGLLELMLSEHSHGSRVQRDGPQPGASLWWAEVAGAADLYCRLGHPQLAAVKVDVDPAQAAHLAPSHPSDQRQVIGREQRIGSAGVQKLSRLTGCPHGACRRGLRWQLDVLAMVALTAWTDRFWAQLDANGEGGVGLRLHLVVNQVGPQGSPVVRATSTVSG